MIDRFSEPLTRLLNGLPSNQNAPIVGGPYPKKRAEVASIPLSPARHTSLTILARGSPLSSIWALRLQFSEARLSIGPLAKRHRSTLPKCHASADDDLSR
jgi:hypothetical protein